MNLKKLLFPLALIIIVITASVITTYFFNSNNVEEAKQKQNPHEFMNYIYKELNLNEEQAISFSEFTGEFHRNGKQLSKDLKQKKLMFLEELTKVKSDSLILTNLVNEISEIESKLTYLTLDHYFKSVEILDSVQLKSLKKIYSEMLPDSTQAHI